MESRPCICGKSEAAKVITVVERQVGLGDPFTYIECGKCGSLRIAEIPDNLDRYYPRETYYSFKNGGGWRDKVQPYATQLAFLGVSLPALYFPWASVARAAGISRSDRVLDVGSGMNGLATCLRAAGCEAMGVDPFIKSDVSDSQGIAVKKAFLADLRGEWEAITFNHSLEHIADPLRELRIARELLSSTGRVIVRIPVVSTAYKTYGPNWFQIDAPRHLFIPTERAFRDLASEAGYVSDVIYDSDYLQFWQSENYEKGRNMLWPGTPQYWQHITRSERRRLNLRARALNTRGQGDQAIFVLQRH